MRAIDYDQSVIMNRKFLLDGSAASNQLGNTYGNKNSWPQPVTNTYTIHSNYLGQAQTHLYNVDSSENDQTEQMCQISAQMNGKRSTPIETLCTNIMFFVFVLS